MVTTTIGGLMAVQTVLDKLKGEKCGAAADGIPMLDAYKIMRLTNRIAPEVAAARESQNKLIRDFGVGPDSNGNYRVPMTIDGDAAPDGSRPQVANPAWAEYVSAVQGLHAGQVDLEEVTPIARSVIEKAKTLMVADLFTLDPFLRAEEEEAK
jgi:hypothetical protein